MPKDYLMQSWYNTIPELRTRPRVCKLISTNRKERRRIFRLTEHIISVATRMAGHKLGQYLVTETYFKVPGKLRETMTVHDIAAYILSQTGPMTAMKLQKLVYYSQAWSLVWDEAPLFEERIEAWANGPVVPALYEQHRGQFQISPPWEGGDPTNLTEEQRETVDAILKYYGDKSSRALSEITHCEDPWRLAREGLSAGERGTEVITHAAMAEYYESLLG